MALIRELKKVSLESRTHHTEADCTYSVVFGEDGEKCLQLDTYGSGTRKMTGKKSQSMRFTPEALAQLMAIISTSF